MMKRRLSSCLCRRFGRSVSPASSFYLRWADAFYLKKKNSTFDALLFPASNFLPLSPPDFPSLLRPLQPGGVCGRHLRPAAARPAAPRSHPDPQAAGRGGRLWWLQHRAQRAQLLPARKSAHTMAHAQMMTEHMSYFVYL